MTRQSKYVGFSNEHLAQWLDLIESERLGIVRKLEGLSDLRRASGSPECKSEAEEFLLSELLDRVSCKASLLLELKTRQTLAVR